MYSKSKSEGHRGLIWERAIKLCNWMTNNHTKLPIPSGNVCSVLLCTAQVTVFAIQWWVSSNFPSLKEQMHEWLSFWMWWPQVKEVRVLPATDFGEEDANNCEKKVDLELRTVGMGSSRGMWESVMGSGWQGGLLDGCGTCGILVSRPGILYLGPRQWKCRVLTTGPPGNSLDQDLTLFPYPSFS